MIRDKEEVTEVGKLGKRRKKIRIKEMNNSWDEFWNDREKSQIKERKGKKKKKKLKNGGKGERKRGSSKRRVKVAMWKE